MPRSQFLLRIYVQNKASTPPKIKKKKKIDIYTMKYIVDCVQVAGQLTAVNDCSQQQSRAEQSSGRSVN